MVRKKEMLFIFICFIISCMALFLILDFFFPQYHFEASLIKYSTVWASFFLSVHGKNRKFIYAQAFTLICDYYLLFTSFYTFGILFFSIVQLCYLSSFLEQKKKTVCFYSLIHPLLFLTGLGYAILLFSNLCYSAVFSLYRKRITDFMLFFGFVCFCFCDVSIILYQVFDLTLFGSLIWLFYTPSQALIAITNYCISE